MADVLALSDDEDTPRKPLLRPGTRPCTPVTPGNVVCLGSDDDEAELKVTPVVVARKARRKGTFFDLDDCSIVSVTPAKTPVSRLEDCTIIREVPSLSKKRSPRMPDVSIGREVPPSSMKTTSPRMPDPSIIITPPRMSDPSIRGEEPSSSLQTPPKMLDLPTIGAVASSSMITPPPRLPDPYENQIPTDWTPHWSPEWSPEVEEPQMKRQRSDAASPPHTPAHEFIFSDDPTPPGNPIPAPAPAPAPCDLAPPVDVGMSQRSAFGAKKVSEEERQRRLREKELELERKQAEREEKKREKEEAKRRQQEEIKQKKEDEKARKVAARKEALERRKTEQDVAKFKSKVALKKMVAFVDPKVVEKGLIGGPLLSRFAERDLTLRVEKNPLESSITLRTKRPVVQNHDSESEDDDDVTGSQVRCEDIDIEYLIFIFEAEEFSALVAESALYTHARKAQVLYPGYTICYVVNKLMAFLKKKEQDQYQSPHLPANIGWKRPPVEKALAGLLTNFTDVHSRICIDEAEVADHVIQLMPVLAKSYCKPKLSKLSVLKNGNHVRHDDAFKEEITQNLWMKVLNAIPKVSGSCAVSIGKTYPTMRSLYSVYLDKQKTEREKELLLQNLRKETVFGSGGQKIGPVCSKRVFHVLMAQDGNMKVDNIEELVEVV